MGNPNAFYQEAFVYELIDPRDNSPFYIGATVDPEQRLRKHVSRSKRAKNGHFDLTQRRIQDIVNSCNRVEMCVLEAIKNVTGRALAQRETYWIHYRWYIDGVWLTNIRSGNSEILDEYMRKHRTA